MDGKQSTNLLGYGLENCKFAKSKNTQIVKVPYNFPLKHAFELKIGIKKISNFSRFFKLESFCDAT